MTRAAAESATRRRVRRLGRAAAYGLTVTVVITGIALLVRERWDPLLRADNAAIRAATDITRAHPTLRSALVVWQEVSQPLNGYIVATGACLWMWLRKRYTSRAWWAFLTMMVAWNVQLDIKLLVQRARPVVQDAVSHAPGYSFPSGHAANAAAASTALVVLLWPVLSRRGRVVAVAAGATWTAVTALDRVFLGVHFPSDVSAGVILGAGLVLASLAGYHGWTPAHEGDPARPHTPGDLEVPDRPAPAGPRDRS